MVLKLKMIKYIRVAVLLFCASFVFSTVWAVQTFTPAQNISISDGLAHNGVTSIFQDSRGIFWLGTYDGLNRYDGYKFRTYKNSKLKIYLQ